MARPPTFAATTGVPQAWASMATRPKDSLYDGTHTIEAAAYQSASSSWATGGTNRARSAIPRPAARSSSAVGRSSPLPDGPPTIATVVRSRRPDAIRRAAASSTTSGALSGWMRPANRITSWSCGRPRAARAAARSRGRKRSRSTPGWTTSTRAGSAPYSSTICVASSAVFAIRRSATSTSSCSPATRPAGSALSPAARLAFLTLAIVCIEWINGTPHRSRAT